MPLATAPPARPETTCLGPSRTAALLANRPLDLGHDPLLRVEEARVHLHPAVEPELRRADREEPRRLEEVVALRHALDHRAVALIGECLLGRGRPEVLVEGLRSRLPQA